MTTKTFLTPHTAPLTNTYAQYRKFRKPIVATPWQSPLQREELSSRLGAWEQNQQPDKPQGFMRDIFDNLVLSAGQLSYGTRQGWDSQLTLLMLPGTAETKKWLPNSNTLNHLRSAGMPKAELEGYALGVSDPAVLQKRFEELWSERGDMWASHKPHVNWETGGDWYDEDPDTAEDRARTHEVKRKVLAEFTERLAQRQHEQKQWITRNPDLLPVDERYFEGMDKHPELAGDLKYWTYLISGTLVYTAAAMAAIGTGWGLTGATIAGVGLSTAILSPALTDEATQAMLEAGATPEQAIKLAPFVGAASAFLESSSDFVMGGLALGGGSSKSIVRALRRNLSKVLLKNFGTKAIAATGATMITEMATELTQEMMVNAARMTVDETAHLFDNLSEIAKATAIVSFGLGAPAGVMAGFQTPSYGSRQFFLQNPQLHPDFKPEVKQRMANELTESNLGALLGAIYAGQELAATESRTEQTLRRKESVRKKNFIEQFYEQHPNDYIVTIDLEGVHGDPGITYARGFSSETSFMPYTPGQTVEGITAPGDIAFALGLKYDGMQEGIGHQYTDPQTGSTTYGNTFEEVQANIESMRGNFEAAVPKPTEAAIEAASGVEGGVPIFITKQMEADLKKAGQTQQDIDKMTPQEAWDIIRKQEVTPEVFTPVETKAETRTREVAENKASLNRSQQIIINAINNVKKEITRWRKQAEATRQGMKGMTGDQIRNARLAIKLIETQESASLDMIKKGTPVANSPTGAALRGEIGRIAEYKGLRRGKQWSKLIESWIEQRKYPNDLRKMTIPQLETLLKKVVETRPVKIGKNPVITLDLEQRLESLREALIKEGAITEDIYYQEMSKLGMAVDKYVDGRAFASQTDALKLIGRIQHIAVAGVQKKIIQDQKFLAANPGIKKVVDMLSTPADLQGKTFNPSQFLNMNKFFEIIERNTDVPISQAWNLLIAKFREGNYANRLMRNKLEESVGRSKFTKIRGDKAALQRVEAYIMSRADLDAMFAQYELTAPENTESLKAAKEGLKDLASQATTDERSVANAIIEGFKTKEHQVRYERVRREILKNLDLLGSKSSETGSNPSRTYAESAGFKRIVESFPDVKKNNEYRAQLQEAVGIWLAQGDAAMEFYLRDKSWGVIESGYTPQAASYAKIFLQTEIASQKTNTKNLHARMDSGLSAMETWMNQKEDIITRYEHYMKHRLANTLEPIMTEMIGYYDQVQHRFTDPHVVARQIADSFLEIQGRARMAPIVKMLTKLGGYAFSVISLNPKLLVRNLHQPLAYPFLEVYFDPRNRKTTMAENMYYDVNIDQFHDIREWQFIDTPAIISTNKWMGKFANNVNRFVRAINYYGVTDTFNRKAVYWAAINKASRAMAEYNKTRNLDNFIKSSGLLELSVLERAEVLKAMTHDKFNYGTSGIPSATGQQQAVQLIAKGLVEQTQFLYNRAERAPVEHGEIGRVVGNLMTFPRSYITRLWQIAARLTSTGGLPGERRAAAKTLIELTTGTILAGISFAWMTGEDRNPYDPRNIISYDFGGLTIGAWENVTNVMRAVFDASMGDEAAVDRAIRELSNTSKTFIPLYKQAIHVLESATDKQNIDRMALRKLRSHIDRTYQYDSKGYEMEMNLAQKLVHALFGATVDGEKVYEIDEDAWDKIRGVFQPSLMKKTVPPSIERLNPGSTGRRKYN